MEAAGLVARRVDPTNRRVHHVELTADGEALFHRLRAAAVAFDARLRAGFADADLATLETFLDRLRDNVADGTRGVRRRHARGAHAEASQR
jgi:MarR family transcriptional regulator for hemolysin